MKPSHILFYGFIWMLIAKIAYADFIEEETKKLLLLHRIEMCSEIVGDEGNWDACVKPYKERLESKHLKMEKYEQ